MKKKFAWIMVLALALVLLASCADSGNDSSSAPSLPDEPTALDYDRSFSHNSNGLYTNVGSTEDTFYYVLWQDKLIRYADKATGTGGPLCGKPECTHDNADCNAYLPGAGLGTWGLATYDGRLYWVGTNNSAFRHIYSCALDGTDRRVVRDLDREFTSHGAEQAQFHRGYLYWCNNDSTVVDGKAQRIARVLAFSLDPDGEDLVILEEENREWVRLQPYLGGLYIAVVGGEVGRTDYDLILYRWDIQTRELEEFYRGVVPFIMWELWVTDDGILMHGDYPTESGWDRSVYKFSFESGEVDELFPMVDSVEGEYTYACSVADGLFVANTVTGSGEMKLLVKDFQGNTVLDTTLRADWLTFNSPMFCYGTDETYMYFFYHDYRNGNYAAAVPLDGSEIKLLWSSDEGSY